MLRQIADEISCFGTYTVLYSSISGANIENFFVTSVISIKIIQYTFNYALSPWQVSGEAFAKRGQDYTSVSYRITRQYHERLYVSIVQDYTLVSCGLKKGEVKPPQNSFPKAVSPQNYSSSHSSTVMVSDEKFTPIRNNFRGSSR